MVSASDQVAHRKAEIEEPLSGLTDTQLRAFPAEQLRGAGRRLASLTSTEAERPPAEGEWSAAQVGEHLLLAIPVMTQMVAPLARGEQPEAAEWERPPAGAVHDPERVSAGLEAAAGEVQRAFDAAAETDRRDATFEDYWYGALDWRQWYYLIGLHVHHHEEQMTAAATAARQASRDA